MKTIDQLHHANNALSECMLFGHPVEATHWARRVSELATQLASEIDAGSAEGVEYKKTLELAPYYTLEALYGESPQSLKIAEIALKLASDRLEALDENNT